MGPTIGMGMGTDGGASTAQRGGEVGLGGMGSGGTGMPGGQTAPTFSDNQVRNNFGVTPAFGAPDNSGRSNEGYDALPNGWQRAGGSSTSQEFRENLSLVVTAPQETQQAAEHFYMNSLAITLPARGKEYFFTTPRGDAVLSVNGVSKSMTRLVIGLLILLVGMVLIRSRTDRTSIDSPFRNQ